MGPTDLTAWLAIAAAALLAVFGVELKRRIKTKKADKDFDAAIEAQSEPSRVEAELAAIEREAARDRAEADARHEARVDKAAANLARARTKPATVDEALDIMESEGW